MENNYMFCYVMEFKCHLALDIPTMPFLISGTKSKNNLKMLRNFLREYHQKIFFL